MSESKIEWYHDFIGMGYHVYDVRPTVYLLFDDRKKLVNTWSEIIKYWPDDEIKIRFFEEDPNYELVLYSPSRILMTTWVFLKSLKISEHYLQFKEEYNGSALLKLALYQPKKDGKYELEIFKYKKKITDVKFLQGQDQDDDIISSQARKILQQNTRQNP
jgi:hypothetical protein